MTFREQALRKDRDQVLEFDAQEQFALGTHENDDAHENRWAAMLAKGLTAILVAFGLTVIADWAVYDGQHVQIVVDLFRHTDVGPGRGV